MKTGHYRLKNLVVFAMLSPFTIQRYSFSIEIKVCVLFFLKKIIFFTKNQHYTMLLLYNVNFYTKIIKNEVLKYKIIKLNRFF